MPRLRKDRDETPARRWRGEVAFHNGHLSGQENARRGSERDPSLATHRRTPNADERAGIRSGERGEDRSKAAKKRFGR